MRFPVTSPVPASCFVEVFSKKFGYRECDSGDYEFGYQKIVIYANALGVTHMARQHLWGIGWLSKLGALEDIIHESVADVNGDMDPMAQQYGEPVQYMKRSWWIALIRFCLLKSSFAAFKFALYRLVIPWHHKRLDEL
ncbi:MAG: hypothetical protein HYX26_01845 [Acidobacteriales bacterium]|nr:hypothetical protein [Terriglobales bacterium]